MKDNPKLLSLLGMCRKAGKLSCGRAAAISSIRRKKARLCLLCRDASERLKKEARREADFAGGNVPVRELYSTMDEFSLATGLERAVIAVNDENFAKRALELLDAAEEVNL